MISLMLKIIVNPVTQYCTSHTAAYFLLALLSSPIVASEKLTILTEQSYPLSYTLSGNDDGEVIGYGVDIVKAVMEEANLEYDITIVPWKRAIHTIEKQRNILVFAMTRTKEREARYHWVGKMTSVQYSLYGFKKNIVALPHTIDAAKNLRIGVVRNDVISEYLLLKGFTNLVPVSANVRNFMMSQRGRIDMFPYSSFGFEFFARRNGFDPNEYSELITLPELSSGMYMVFGLDTDSALLARVQNAYNEVVSSGLHLRIIESLRP